MNPYDWQEYFLLVSFSIGRDPISFLLDHVSQDQFFERALQHTAIPQHVTVMRLTEGVFEQMEPHFRRGGYVIEGE